MQGDGCTGGVGPKNFVIAVSGDFDRGEMVQKLEKAFAGWPKPGERPGLPPAPTAPSTPGWLLVDKDVNQARVSMGLPTIDRYDPEWAAAQVMNVANDEISGRCERDPKFYAEFRDRIRAVTLADVQRVARSLLDPAKMTVLFVGNADDILRGDGKHDVTIASLAGGEPKRLSLRDPLTMKPQANP